MGARPGYSTHPATREIHAATLEPRNVCISLVAEARRVRIARGGSGSGREPTEERIGQGIEFAAEICAWILMELAACLRIKKEQLEISRDCKKL